MEYKNILIIKMSALGDVMHALPCAEALRKLYPDAKISWIVHPQFGAFIPEPPTVDEVIYFDKVKFNKMPFLQKISYAYRLRQDLRNGKFDLVIDLQGLFKSAVISWMTGCPKRIGYNDMREGSGVISRAIHGANEKGHVVQQYLDVIRFLGSDVKEPTFPMPALKEEKQQMTERLQKEYPEIDWQKTVVLVPGAGWVTKEWPVEHFAELARRLIQDGNTIILVGGPAETAKGEAIEKAFENDKGLINLIGKTKLLELAALMGLVSFCVGGDTGPVHTAAAMGCRLIALFGPSSAHRAGPYGRFVTIISSSEKCCPCFKRKCPINKNCMDKITVDEVYKACKLQSNNNRKAGKGGDENDRA